MEEKGSHKKDDKTEKENYPPIISLPNLNKCRKDFCIIRSINILKDFCLSINVVSAKYQCGFPTFSP